MNAAERLVGTLIVLSFFVLSVAARAGIKTGDIPPDLLGETPKGEVIRISDHRGRVLVVSFWASWCSQCHRKFPSLDLLQQHLDPERLRVVMVNFKEHPRVYRDILRNNRKSPVTWTSDPEGVVSRAFDVRAIPHTFLIDKSGRVAMVQLGYSKSATQELFEAIDQVLAEPYPATTAVGD